MRPYFKSFSVARNVFLDTASFQSFVIPILAAIISLFIVPLIMVSHVPVMFSDGRRLMEFNNRVSPLSKLNAFMTFVCCRYTKIWNWFEDIQYILRFMNILLFVVRWCGLSAFDFIDIHHRDYLTSTGAFAMVLPLPVRRNKYKIR